MIQDPPLADHANEGKGATLTPQVSTRISEGLYRPMDRLSPQTHARDTSWAHVTHTPSEIGWSEVGSSPSVTAILSPQRTPDHAFPTDKESISSSTPTFSPPHGADASLSSGRVQVHECQVSYTPIPYSSSPTQRILESTSSWEDGLADIIGSSSRLGSGKRMDHCGRGR